jgi:hypothetical protein
LFAGIKGREGVEAGVRWSPAGPGIGWMLLAERMAGCCGAPGLALLPSRRYKVKIPTQSQEYVAPVVIAHVVIDPPQKPAAQPAPLTTT